jgi:hypothetical protein
MNYIKCFSIWESETYQEPGRFSPYKDLTIPKSIQLNIIDISLELKDDGYTVSYQWWPPYEKYHTLYEKNKYPYVSITKNIGNLDKIKYTEIKELCEHLTSYLDSEDYNTVIKYRKVNSADYHVIPSDHICSSIHYKIEIIDRNIYGDID